MGAVDLVIQVESPKSVTAGLQRIGRAGHGVGEISRGRIFPKFRADLLECAVVAKRMRDGDIEPTVVPRNPLDVLAQQIVAMTASGDELKVPALHDTVRRAYPFSELSRELLDSVLDMLDGRYPSEEFAELRPRIVWDRVEDTIRRPPRCAPARRHERGHDPGPRPVWRSPARRPPGRRAGRGDGLRGSPGADVPARSVHVADRGDHPRPRDRDPRTRRSGRHPVLEGRRHRPAQGARARDRGIRTRVRGSRSRGARRRLRPRRSGRAQPVRVPARAARRHAGCAERPDHRGRALPRRDRRLAPVRALALRRARALRMGARAVGPDPRRVRSRVRRDLVGRRHHRPPSRRGRAAVCRSLDDRAGRDRGHGGARSCRAPRSSAHAFARTRPARCCSRAPTPASARRCGSSG